MVGYPDVFPFARRLEFTHAQEPWLSDDQYCCNPKCLCQEAVLSFIRLSQRAGREPLRPTLSLSYRYREGKVCWVDPEKNPGCSEQDLLESLKNARPDLNSLLAKRQGLLRRFVRPYGEKADASDRDAQNWSQRPLPLRQWQEVEEMLRSLICAHRCCPPGLRSDHTRKQPTGGQPLEQRWVATAIVTRIDELFVRGLRSSIARWRLWIKRWKVRRIARASTSREPAPRA
jgi:hypothetical protein